MTTAPPWGVVRAAQANFYRVQLAGSEREVLCTRRARLKKLGQQVVVGDRVEVVLEGEEGAIISVLPRQVFLDRPPIANADQALVVFALTDPPLDEMQLSRFLVHIEALGLVVQICLNKSDLSDPDAGDAWRQRLAGWGYEPLLVSAKTGVGLETLRGRCRGKLSVLTGPSGVGKSSLLNCLCPGLELATQPVSGRLRHGRHTTRHVELFALDPASWIADSPGFNQADLSPCRAATLGAQFPEVRSRLGRCQFRDCLHQEEPGCAVRLPDWERYPLYLALLAEIQGAQRPSEPALKPGSDLLRQPQSRRQGRQRVQIWRGDVSALFEADGSEG